MQINSAWHNLIWGSYFILLVIVKIFWQNLYLYILMPFCTWPQTHLFKIFIIILKILKYCWQKDILVCTKFFFCWLKLSQIQYRALSKKKKLCLLLFETVLLFLLHQVICFHQDLQWKSFESTTCTLYNCKVNKINPKPTNSNNIIVLSCTSTISIHVLNSFPQVLS